MLSLLQNTSISRETGKRISYHCGGPVTSVAEDPLGQLRRRYSAKTMGVGPRVAPLELFDREG